MCYIPIVSILWSIKMTIDSYLENYGLSKVKKRRLKCNYRLRLRKFVVDNSYGVTI